MKDLVLVTNENGVAMTSSLKIAEVFGKEHKNVISKIREKEHLFDGLNFELVKYTDNKGEKRPMYLLDRDFTTFLIMGFTGSKADEWKMKYIKAFNEMEQMLKDGTQLTEKQKLELQLFSKNKAEVAEAHKKLLELETKPLIETIEEQKCENAKLKPKADFANDILLSPGTVTITQIAKDYGMSGAEMNNLLHKLKIQYKVNGQWVLYAKYDDKGYTKSCTQLIKHTYGTPEAIVYTRWTEKGREFLNELLKNEGIYPIKKGDF